MAYATLFKMNQVSDTKVAQMDNIVFYDPDNLEPVPKVNVEGYNQLKQVGRMTPEEFRNGFKIQQGTEERPMTAEYKAELGAQRDRELAIMEAGKDKELARLQKKLAGAVNEEAKLEFGLRIKRLENKYASNVESTKRFYTKQMNEKTYEAPRMTDSLDWFKDVDGTVIENDDGTVTYTGKSLEYQVYLQFHDAISSLPLTC